MLIITLITGCLASLAILVFSGAIEINPGVINGVLWGVLLSILCFSLFLLLALAVSSMVKRPSVSLIILLVCWVVFTFAVPGIGRLLGEMTVDVPSQFQIEKDIDEARNNAWENGPPEAGSYNGDPFAEFMPARAGVYQTINRDVQRIVSSGNERSSEQVKAVQVFSSVSPSALTSDALQKIAGTGVYGFDKLLEYARRYRQRLHDFVVETDSNDPDTPHL